MGRPAARRDPDDRSLKDRAHALSRCGRYREAAAICRELVKRNPREPSLQLQLAEVCRRTGCTGEALSAWRTAAALLEAAGHTARAHAALRCALQLAPTDPQLLAALLHLSPPAERHLALVPPPRLTNHEVPEAVEVFDDDQPVTNPYCPLFDWIGPAPPLTPRRYP